MQVIKTTYRDRAIRRSIAFIRSCSVCVSPISVRLRFLTHAFSRWKSHRITCDSKMTQLLNQTSAVVQKMRVNLSMKQRAINLLVNLTGMKKVGLAWKRLVWTNSTHNVLNEYGFSYLLSTVLFLQTSHSGRSVSTRNFVQDPTWE